MSLGELTTAVGLHKSTVHRLLMVLEAHRLVEKSPINGHYRLGLKLFELGGTRSTLKKHNFDRHWRNARVHTLHDPVRWKYHVVGNWLLNGIKPPRHDWS